ncbi:type IV pilin protein [Candidatus Avelusimicrobium sp.]|uniref:type IV pilin protein n=1 Tax=Candidatus Avelusimicrobium sp. TaxID=3048833 RepID=UPI003D7DF28F
MKGFTSISRAATCASGVIPECVPARSVPESVVAKRRDSVTLRAAKPYGRTSVWGVRTVNTSILSSPKVFVGDLFLSKKNNDRSRIRTLRDDGLTAHSHMATTAGFTLIELLVVVLIIGILAAVAMPQYEKAVKKARLTKVIPLVKTLANAEEVFYMSNGYYTGNVSELDVDMPAGGTFAGQNTDDGYLRFPDGTVVDLLSGTGHQGISNPGNLMVVAYFQDGLRYIQYLEHSSRPNMRVCQGNEAVCKSMGGTQIAGSSQYQLP